MKRLCLLLAIAISSLTTALFFVPKPVSADLNDFHFSSFEADYYLSKDNEGHSTMRVVEKLIAEFVDFNQNRGILRAIPRFYDGHTVAFDFISMERNGVVEPLYEKKNDGQFTVLSTRRDDYVNGTQEYIFTYTLRDVTKDFGNHQELYWDTNGTGWGQSFDNLNVRVHLDKSISDAFTGAISCYQGVEGSKTSCSGTIDGDTISFSSNGSLYAGQNLTYDLSFKPETFVGYQATVVDFIPYVLVTIAALLLAAACIIKFRYGRDSKGRGTIIAEYLPPKDVSIFLSAEILDLFATASTAQILDLAVRHKIRIIESEGKMLFVGYKKYSLELLNVDGLNEDETTFISSLFGRLVVGARYEMNRSNRTMIMKIAELTKAVRKESEDLGFRLRQTKLAIIQWLMISAACVILIVSIIFSADNFNEIGAISGVIGFATVVLLLLFVKLGSIRPLTSSGRELYDYLKGLKMYIELAEADRIRVLQSPSGAETRPIDTSDTSNMVVLYERVLPYAVLFGQEKEWLQQLGTYYESSQSTPGWYIGASAFNAAAFASAVSGFSNYSNSSASSSSSGAGGGGSSGGGGGGGGGGGA